MPKHRRVRGVSVRLPAWLRGLALACPAAIALGCDSTSSTSSDGGATTSPEASATTMPQSFALNITAVDTTFVTRDHFMAAVEMQLSGEPFAEAMGRDLGGYSRDFSCQACSCDPSLYHDPALNGGVAGGPVARDDLAGFSSAVESYEYSKQAMNDIAFESGAGTALAFGPVLNAAGATGTDALQPLRDWVQHLAAGSNAVSRFVHSEVTAQNPLGWPGLWPTLQPYASWDPSIKASNASTGCSISSDDDPGASGSLACDDYECDYTTLHLPDRTAQVKKTIDPGSSGWAGWKEALWTLNYLQVMHDSTEAAVSTVPAAQLALVGTTGNTVVGADDTGAATASGTFLGSSDIEGFQAGNFLQILDNQGQQWLTQLTTTDGATLGGFASLADALAYSPASPLRWFPGSIDVTESDDASGFPRPTGYAIASPDSHLLDLAGLLGAYASIYSLTDQSNAQVGGSQPAMAYFDGDPFPVQNQTPTGQATLHDRALALARVLVVNMDRLHVDPTTGMFVDDVALAGAKVTRGTTLSTDVAAYALLSLRTVRRAVDDVLTLYSNTKPDAKNVPSPLDSFPPLDGMTYAARLDQLVGSLSSVFLDQLTTADGHANSGWESREEGAHRRRVEARRPHGGHPRPPRRLPGDGRHEVPRPRVERLRAPRERVLRPEGAHLPDHGRRHLDAGDLHGAPVRPPPGGAEGHLRAHRGAPRPAGHGLAHRGPRLAPEQAGARRVGRSRRGRRHLLAGGVRPRHDGPRRQAAAPRGTADGRARPDRRIRIAPRHARCGRWRRARRHDRPRARLRPRGLGRRPPGRAGRLDHLHADPVVGGDRRVHLRYGERGV